MTAHLVSGSEALRLKLFLQQRQISLPRVFSRNQRRSHSASALRRRFAMGVGVR